MAAPVFFVVQFLKGHKLLPVEEESRSQPDPKLELDSTGQTSSQSSQPHIFLEDKFKELLKEQEVTNQSWTTGRQPSYKDDQGRHPDNIQVMFSCNGGKRVDDILKGLLELGIGQEHSDTSIHIFPITSRYPVPQVGEKETDTADRASVLEVMRGVEASAALSLDFVLLCVAASIIAAFGLVRDDPVATIASMLVSPLMGPILAVTFGTVIRSPPLAKLGLRNESIGLGICLVIGLVIGLICGTFGNDWGWPTTYMTARGEAMSLVVGLGIAIPSGIGVALSVLGNNTSSLVGVAISASLLPPAVNAGLNFGFAIIAAAKGEDGIPHADLSEVATVGGISFCLTLLNILVIYLMGVTFLLIKSVTPESFGATPFWRNAVPAFRHHQMKHDPTVGTRGLGYPSEKRLDHVIDPANRVDPNLHHVKGDKGIGYPQNNTERIRLQHIFQAENGESLEEDRVAPLPNRVTFSSPAEAINTMRAQPSFGVRRYDDAIAMSTLNRRSSISLTQHTAVRIPPVRPNYQTYISSPKSTRQIPKASEIFPPTGQEQSTDIPDNQV